MKNRAKRAAEDDEYSGQSTYLRAMIHVGESRIADLDPRSGEGQSNLEEVETVEAAAKALNDKVILNELSQEKQEFDAVVEQLTLEFENVLADRLHEMANNDQSAVETDGRGNYYLSR